MDNVFAVPSSAVDEEQRLVGKKKLSGYYIFGQYEILNFNADIEYL